jgi:hypothetical protein
MDLDRRKHDVDVIERVLGGIHDRLVPDEPWGRVIDVTVPSSSGPTAMELVVNLADEPPAGPDSRRR